MPCFGRLFPTLVLVMCCAVCPALAAAQPFSSFLQEAVTRHDLVQAAEARLDAAQAALGRAQGARLPHVDAAINAGLEHTNFPGDQDSTSEFRDYQRLTASQLLYDFGRTGAGIGRSQANLERAEAELIATRQEIMLRGVVAYLDVLRHKERLRLARESEARIMNLTGIEETLVNKGAGLASDVLQAKSQLAGARALRVRVEGQLQVARDRFVTIFGVQGTDELLDALIQPSLPLEQVPGSLDQAQAAAEDNSLELLMARQNIEMARQDVLGSEAGLLPRLHLVGEAKRRHNDQGVEGTRTEALGMVELTWELFSGGSERAAVREAQANLRDQQRKVSDLENMVEERVATAWHNLASTRESAVLLREQATILEEFLALAKRERLLGTRSLLDVLNGEIGHLNALSNAVFAETERAIALYNLFYAMGRLDYDLLI